MNESNPAGRGRILFADDDPIFRSSLSTHLNRRGFECDCTASASEALERLRATEFDALVADIQMPGNHDLQLINEILRMAPGLPVILLTDVPAMETITQSLALPVIAYLVKPPDVKELSSLLGEAVRIRQGRRAAHACRERLHHWDGELREIERRFLAQPQSDGPDPHLNFVSLTLRNLILTLVDLERSVSVLCHQSDPGSLGDAELVLALRRTVAVLEKTKRRYKSKELGALRQELTQVLSRW